MAKLSWKTEQRFVKDLMIAEINPRKISKEQKEALQKSLEKFNLADIPVLNTDNTIISGNQRLQILYELGKGDEKIDVRVPNRKLTEDELKEYMLIANTHAGVFDVELLEAHFEDVNIDFDIQLVDDNGKITVKGHERVKKGLTEDDEIPEPPKLAKSKPGQIWILGDHRLMCGDSTKKEDVELLMAGKKADMVFTDPPYNVNYGANNSHNTGALSKKDRGIKNDFMEGDQFTEFIMKSFENVKLFCDGVIYCFGAQGKDGRIMFTVLDKMFHNSGTIIWVKDSLVLGRSKYHNKYEPCWFGWNKSGDSFTEDRTLTNVWEFPRPKKSELHPTMKPVELIENAINHNPKIKSLLDLFSGSGSGMIACEKMGRSFYGMELDPIYIDVIIKRWQDFTGQ